MIAAWMLYCSLCAAGLTLAAALAERVLLAGRAPVRVVWVAAQAASVVVPLLLFSISSTTSPRPPAPPVAATVDAALEPISADAVTTSPSAGTSAPVDHDWRHVLSTLDRPLAVAWLTLSAALTVSFAGGLIALAAMRRRWTRRDAQGIPVYVSRGTGPAVVGAIAPAIVVPEWALSLPPTQLALMLRHEQEHLRARDGQLLIAAQLALIAMPWNFALWWQLVSLRVAIEMDCDARVLRHADARSYGELLLEVARPHRSFNLAGMIAFAERATQLERRIRVLHRHRSAPAPRTLLAASGIALLALTAAWIAPHPAGLARHSAATEASSAALRVPQLHDVQAEHLSAAPAPSVATGTPSTPRVARVMPRLDCAEDTSIVGATYRTLFTGVSLSRDNESKACDLLARLADEQLAEDAVAQATEMSARARRSSIQSNRDASLMALLETDTDRAMFSANVARLSAAPLQRGRIGGDGGARGATGAIAARIERSPDGGRVGRGASILYDTMIYARGRGDAAAADSQKVLLARKPQELEAIRAPVAVTNLSFPGGGAITTVSVDSSSMNEEERARVADRVKVLMEKMAAMNANLTYERLFHGITLSADEAAQAHRILSDAQTQMAAETPAFVPVTRLRLNPGRGIVRMAAGPDTTLVNLAPASDRQTVRSRIVTVHQ